MSELIPLRTKDISPYVIVQSLAADAGKLDELFAVGIDKQGNPVIWSSGDLGGMAFAAAALQKAVMELMEYGGEE
jgi:hypothetical protein